MLIQFTLENYKSFRQEAKFSLIASNYDKDTREDENVFTTKKFGLRLLRSAVMYGANASGKSKLIEGLGEMKNFILNSSKESQIDEPIDVIPFLLSTETENEPTSFEIIFIHENEMFRYGFQIDKKEVHSEWLYHKAITKEVEIFYRDYQTFDFHPKRFKVKDLIENDRIRPNALLLSVAANWNDALAKKVIDWFKNFNIISGLRDEGYSGYSMSRIQDNKKNKLKTLKFLKDADLGIEDISVKKLALEDLPDGFPEELREMIQIQMKENKQTDFFSDVNTYHKKYDKNNLLSSLVEFSLKDDESSGTNKIFSLSGPIIETLENGEILIVDELANKLHSNLSQKLIEIFNSKEHNPNNAQLIFNTHDTNLLSSSLFRRDQIWFIEKDMYGASSLFSLNDFKTDTVRKEDDFEKRYLSGRYGATPYLSNFSQENYSKNHK